MNFKSKYIEIFSFNQHWSNFLSIEMKNTTYHTMIYKKGELMGWEMRKYGLFMAITIFGFRCGLFLSPLGEYKHLKE